MAPARLFIIPIVASLACAAVACSDDEPDLTRAELLDPETCKSCHPTHYREWSGSMHAYAADDPVFIAMNKRGQRETNGDLGSFCVNCHAPMAVLEGATTDGLNLEDADFPKHLKGVTCFFCHSVTEVTRDHNNGLVLADDNVLRGGISDPFPNTAHRAAYSPLHDRNSQESSKLCGSCHDIVLDNGVHLERTFLEWKTSLFSDPDPRKHLSCSRCHMKGDTPGVVADYPGVPSRLPHEHTFPGVDTAVIDWPEKEAQLAGIARDLNGAILPKLCVGPAAGGVEITYNLDNVFGGHMLPSGATQDRRMWAEIVAYTGDQVVFQSGVVADGDPVADLTDPNLWLLRDLAKDANGDEAHMFWDVVSTSGDPACDSVDPDPAQCFLLPPAVTNDPADPLFNHSVERTYTVVGVSPTRVTARVYLRSIGLEILQDLVASGDLDESLLPKFPTLLLEGTDVEWNEADGFGCTR